MFFSELPKNIQTAIFKLTTDDEFQHRFATDKTLDEIDELKYNKAGSFREGLQVLFKADTYKDIQLSPLTLGKISLLWYMNNDYFSSNKTILQADDNSTDVFLYILQTPFNQLDIFDSYTNAFKYVQNVLNITYEQAKMLIINIIRTSFSPLKKFSSPNIKGKINVRYDGYWLTTLAAIVHSVTGYDTDYIIQKMPVTEVSLYYVVWKKLRGDEVIEHTEEEILILQDQRASMLIVEYLAEKGIIKEDQIQHYYQIIITDPNKKCK